VATRVAPRVVSVTTSREISSPSLMPTPANPMLSPRVFVLAATSCTACPAQADHRQPSRDAACRTTRTGLHRNSDAVWGRSRARPYHRRAWPRKDSPGEVDVDA
jgi:hypothetical protein